MATVPYLLDNLDHYAPVYTTYTKHSSKTGAIADWIESSFGETVVEKLREKTKDVSPLKVLGLGSGSGTLDCPMLEKLLPFYPTISKTVVEPSAAQLGLFKDSVAAKGDTLRGVTFDWVEQTSDEYFERNAEGVALQKFHLIHAVHVLYYVNDLKETLKMLYDRLEEGGVLFIVMGAFDSTTMRMQEFLNEMVPKMRPVIRNDTDVTKTLDELNLPYVKGLVQRYVQAGKILDENSTEGGLILDFITHSKDFRGNASPDMLQGVLKRLTACDDISCRQEGDDGLTVFRHWVHISVAKP